MNAVPWSEVLDHIGAAWQAGYVAGMDRGRQVADDEAATLHREAVRIVHAMSKHDPHDDRERRRRERQNDATERHAREAMPWPEETAPIPRGALEVVLTPAEQAFRSSTSWARS